MDLIYHIEIAYKTSKLDSLGSEIFEQAKELGINSFEGVITSTVFTIRGLESEAEADQVAKCLLTDSLTQSYSINNPILCECSQDRVVQVVRKKGVMDPTEASVLKGIQDLGYSAEQVRTNKKYLFKGMATKEDASSLTTRILANQVIEDIILSDSLIPMPSEGNPYQFQLEKIELTSADDAELLKISQRGVLSLNLEEMKCIQAHYRELGREPTDIELETLAQTWSEHCVHKTLKGDIQFNGKPISNLLKSTIFKATQDLDMDWCVSVFVDNAGIIEFDETYNVCFKVETHNHPSAIEPYGGASTGIGGVIRDCLGTGLGAKPILNTDVFCFAPPDLSESELPRGVQHPKRLMKGVVAGVRDYGNRMGIPTANGAIFFDQRYLGNPLVYCGNLGLIPKDACIKEVKPGDKIVAIGGRTGRDGIHGATFSSVELSEDSEMSSSGAVQIGNAITEKKVMDVLLQARDRGLYHSITDCGAGGFSSAVGEMGEKTGAEVHLEKAPLKYDGLTYTEIWISEAQERMVFAVPPEKEKEFHALMNSEDVESTTIGTFTDSKELMLKYHGETVGQLSMEFLHDGLPRLKREATWSAPDFLDPSLPEKENYGDDLKRILESWNVCSKEWVIRQYDHEVQGGSVLKPLVGAANDGPGDACIVSPVLGSFRGVIVSNGMCPTYGDIDPYAMAASAIDEALRQIIAVGGNLERVALLDNFCWGNTDKPDRLGSLVLAAQACHDMSLAFETPFISGKDSLNNEFQTDDGVITIPPSLLISAIGIMKDVRKAVSMDAKKGGNLIFIIGLTKKELGGSHYFRLYDAKGTNVPQVDPKLSRSVMTAVSRATDLGLIRSCHDCSEGGLAIAAAEMAFAGQLGMSLKLDAVPTNESIKTDEILFSESNARFLIEIEPENKAEIEKVLNHVPLGYLGTVEQDEVFRIFDTNDRLVISENINDLKEVWQRPLRW